MLIAAALTSMSTAAIAGETITYSYDARGRLVQVAHSGTVNPGLNTTYAYDKADNRTSVTTAGSTGGAGTGGTGTGGTGSTGTQPRYIVVPLTGGTLIPISS